MERPGLRAETGVPNPAREAGRAVLARERRELEEAVGWLNLDSRGCVVDFEGVIVGGTTTQFFASSSLAFTADS